MYRLIFGSSVLFAFVDMNLRACIGNWIDPCNNHFLKFAGIVGQQPEIVCKAEQSQVIIINKFDSAFAPVALAIDPLDAFVKDGIE